MSPRASETQEDEMSVAAISKGAEFREPLSWARDTDEIVLMMHRDDPHEREEGDPHPEPQLFSLSGLHLAARRGELENTAYVA